MEQEEGIAANKAIKSHNQFPIHAEASVEISTILLVEKFCKGEYINDVDAKTWQNAFKYIDQNIKSLAFIHSKVHLLWTVNGGHLRNKIRDDSLVLRVLKNSLPVYQGPDLTLYRGECRFLYEKGQIGFCWSTDIEVAKRFGRGLNAIESGGVLLKAHAPSHAILSSPNSHSSIQMREFEYTCDPTQFPEITVIQTFPKLSPAV